MPESEVKVPMLTREQAAIIGLFTGTICGDFADIQALGERLMGHPIFTHQFPAISGRLKALAKPLFLSICFDSEKVGK